MRTSFHHQPEAQHPIFQLSTSWQADYPIFRGKADMRCRPRSSAAALLTPTRTLAAAFCCDARHSAIPELLYLAGDPRSRGNPHEAARLHNARWWHGGGMAARGARAADGDAGDWKIRAAATRATYRCG